MIAAVIVLMVICGCSRNQVMDGDGMLNSYRQISQEEAAEMMKNDDGHIVVDVRTIDEYNEGHIPKAICIPNENIIEGTMPEELPDKSQIILIYCRSGNRSRQAAEKLFNTGYTNIYEFGGIKDWTGDIEY